MTVPKIYMRCDEIIGMVAQKDYEKDELI